MPRRKGSLNKRVVEKILTCLLEAGEPLGVRETCRRTGLHPSTVCRALREMRGRGILTVEAKGRVRLHGLTPPAVKILREYPEQFYERLKRYSTVFTEFRSRIGEILHWLESLDMFGDYVDEFRRLRMEFRRDGVEFEKLPGEEAAFYIFILRSYPKGFERLRRRGWSTIESLRRALTMGEPTVDVNWKMVIESEWRRLKPCKGSQKETP